MALNDSLLDLAARRIDALAVFMPPRHGKSETCSHAFPAWYLGAFPDHRVIQTGYGSDFATSWGRKVRDSVREYGPPVFGVSVRRDVNAAGEWEVVGRDGRPTGGGMLSAGVGAGITGRGANLFSIDDPIKNAEEALSRTTRQKQWDWYLSVADTRLEPDAAELFTATRWHSDDLGSRVPERWREIGRRYRVLTFPALAEDDDPLGRAAGEALWPERYPVRVLEAKRKGGEYWWPALYQQQPVPHGGALFKADWFRQYAAVDPLGVGDPEGYRLAESGEFFLARDCVRFVVVDPAVGKKPTADEVVIAAFAVTPRGQLLVLHVLAKRMPVEQIVGALGEVCAAWHPQFVGMEANGFQVTVAQSARLSPEVRCEVRELEPGSSSKLTRAVPAIERAAAGKLFVPDSAAAGWVVKYLTELCDWTGQDGEKDNQVDVTAYAAVEADNYTGSGAAPAFRGGRGR